VKASNATGRSYLSVAGRRRRRLNHREVIVSRCRTTDHGRRRLTDAAIIRYYQRSGLPDLYSLTDYRRVWFET
jgi:hypothetical protein